MRRLSLGIVLSLGIATTPSTETPSTAIRDVLREHASALSGAVLVARDGKTIFHESFGLANRQFEVLNASDTRFKIASITKLFTATMVLQLQQEGRLALDAPAVSYLPACAGNAGARVTVHQLLNHTSGLKDIVAVKSKEDALRNGIDLYQRPYTTDEILRKYCSAPLEHPPGSTFFYNNGDYVVLGKIVEALEREPFDAVVQRRILRPVGMNHTGMVYQHEIVPRLADSYFTRDDRSRILANDMPVYEENWYAAGAMYSTAADLALFADALFGDKLLKRETLDLLMQPGLDKYGYGVWVYDDVIGGKKFRSVMRPGQIMGTNTVLYRVLEANLTVVILANTDRTNVDALAHEITKALLR